MHIEKVQPRPPANAPEAWDEIWAREGLASWRGEVLSSVYDRIERLARGLKTVVDVGGGVGILASRLVRDEVFVEVLEHSCAAILQAQKNGLVAKYVDLESQRGVGDMLQGKQLVVATEVLEHLTTGARDRFLSSVSAVGARGLFSVPNNRLGPEVEAQHTIQFTAKSFKTELECYFKHVRVEVIDGAFLLGVCGYPKKFSMSLCLPVRDEAEDLEPVLASFRGVADEIVVGVDPRTTDRTREVAALYADVVFELESPEGPPGEKVPDGGVHFAWIRNQCLERCTSDWVFMTEGHEGLMTGVDQLLSLDQMPAYVDVLFVTRSAKSPCGRQEWLFPWLTRRKAGLRYKRHTHNIVDIPEGSGELILTGVTTDHFRVHERELARAKQRKTQNRVMLMRDWLADENVNSLYYLAGEWREHDPDRALDRFRQLLQVDTKNGPRRYQASLILAKMLAERGKPGDLIEARSVLLACTSHDWNRTEHWIWLGDLAMDVHNYEEAQQFYLYAATRIGKKPLTFWWVELSFYSFIPAQRLAEVCSALGDYAASLLWAERVLELLPKDLPEEMLIEAREICETLRKTQQEDSQ